MSRRRVVVTGLGCVSPVGNTVQAAWDSLLAGRSGIARIEAFDPTAFACQIAGEVKNFDLEPYINAKEARSMDRFIHLGIAAAQQAIEDAGLPSREELDDELATRIGVIIGSGIGGLPLIEETHSELTNRGPRRISPFFVPASIINMISGHVSMRHGFKGPNLAIVTVSVRLPERSNTVMLTSLLPAVRSQRFHHWVSAVLRPCAPCPLATMIPPLPRGLGIRTVTVSSSVKVRVSWCWSPTSTPRRAARKFTVSLQATA
jgi:hypothetical protein